MVCFGQSCANEPEAILRNIRLKFYIIHGKLRYLVSRPFSFFYDINYYELSMALF